jgi:hypothetical protein
VPYKSHDFFRQLVGCGYYIGHTCVDGAAGHAVKLRGVGSLHKAGAGGLTDGAQAQGAIHAHARQNDANAVLLAIIGQGFKEKVNRQAKTMALGGFKQMQHIGQHREVVPRGNDVDMVGFNPHLVLGLQYRQGAVPLQQLHQHALAVRVQMLNHHVGHASIQGDTAQELLQGK